MHVGPIGHEDQVSLFVYVGKDRVNFSPGGNAVFNTRHILPIGTWH
jgi:hypothetical protein